MATQSELKQRLAQLIDLRNAHNQTVVTQAIELMYPGRAPTKQFLEDCIERTEAALAGKIAFLVECARIGTRGQRSMVGPFTSYDEAHDWMEREGAKHSRPGEPSELFPVLIIHNLTEPGEDGEG